MLNKLFKKTTVQYDSVLDLMEEVPDDDLMMVVGGFTVNADGTFNWDDGSDRPAGAGVDVDTFAPVEVGSSDGYGISASQTTQSGLFGTYGGAKASILKG